jgi:predicted DsbA family dithiol-disulfide isomerase
VSRRIEVFAEIACPFTHACLHTIVAERTRRGTESPRLFVRAWPLELVNDRAINPRRVAEEIAALRAQVSHELFRATDATHVPSSSIGAFGLAAAAYRCNDDVGEAVGFAIRRALFEEGRDLDDDRALRAIGAPFEVQPLSPEDAASAVDADWQAGRARGVKGSPHVFVGDREWFSPSLEIEKDADGNITVRRDDDTLAAFYAAAFGG